MNKYHSRSDLNQEKVGFLETFKPLATRLGNGYIEKWKQE